MAVNASIKSYKCHSDTAATGHCDTCSVEVWERAHFPLPRFPSVLHKDGGNTFQRGTSSWIMCAKHLAWTWHVVSNHISASLNMRTHAHFSQRDGKPPAFSNDLFAMCPDFSRSLRELGHLLSHISSSSMAPNPKIKTLPMIEWWHPDIQ